MSTQRPRVPSSHGTGTRLRAQNTGTTRNTGTAQDYRAAQDKTAKPARRVSPGTDPAAPEPPSAQEPAAEVSGTKGAGTKGSGTKGSGPRISATRDPRRDESGPAAGEPDKQYRATTAVASPPAVASPGNKPGRWRRRARTTGPEAPEVRQDNILSFPTPARLRRRRNWIIGLCTAAVLTAVLFAVVIFSPLLAVRTISIDGNKLASEQQIRKALAPLEGESLARIGRGDVGTLLAPLAPIEGVRIEAHLPSELVVHVVEHTPVAVLKDGKRFVLIDANGRPLGSVTDRSKAKLPLIDGGTSAVGKEIFPAITGVLAVLPPRVLAQLAHASAKSVDSVEFTLRDGTRVIWGNAGEKELKARVLQALLSAAPKDDTTQVYDISIPTRPVTR